MSSDRRFEKELPSLLDDLFMGPMPAYHDQVLQVTARTRQRPAWTFLARWLPLVDVARQSVMARRIPLRSLGLIVLVVGITLALLAALIAGSRPRVPAPFGLARSGLVAYSANGDIFTADPATGTTTAIVTGPETDLGPSWSRDGTRIAFLRKLPGDPGLSQLYVARVDGSDLTVVTPEPLPMMGTYETSGIAYEFSPDGSEILLSARQTGIPVILVARTDGSGIRELNVGRPATHAAWRPPDGAAILFMDTIFGGLYAVDMRSGEVRTILERLDGLSRDLAAWSPDGSQIAYMEWVNSDSITSRIHIIAADGTGDRVMLMPADAQWEVFRGWSNDGTRLLIMRGYTGGWEESVAVAVPADGSGFGTEIDLRGIRDANCCSAWEWAPDDTSILGTPVDAQGGVLDQVLLDPVTGTSTAVPWTSSSHPAWQRLAR